MATEAYISTGSNLGDRERNLDHALELITAIPGCEVIAVSAVYVTQPQEMEGENPPFLNQVIKIDYEFRAFELLHELEAIEKKLGRTEKGKRMARTIDLDILLFGKEIIETDQLSIPHREMLNRAFVMIPLLQIDPDLVHPVTNRPVSEFLTEEHSKEIVIYKEHVARSI